ncbi:MAG: hypothetical protein IS860_03145 [Nitrosopumilus sp.]|nr:hypothetical protein [Nitrosopumilus sp.]
MMVSSNLERNQAILRLCQDVLASDERIFFVSSLNKNGKSTEFRFRNDRIITKMSKQEAAMFFMQRSLQTSLNKEFDDLIGPLNYICVQRETLLEFIFPYAEGQILVLCDLDVVPNYVAKKISFLLRDFDWRLKETLFT